MAGSSEEAKNYKDLYVEKRKKYEENGKFEPDVKQRGEGEDVSGVDTANGKIWGVRDRGRSKVR